MIKPYVLLCCFLMALSRPASAGESGLPVYLTMGPGVSLFGSQWGAAIYFGLARQIHESVPLVAGLDGAATIWNFRAASERGFLRVTLMGLHLLPSILYRFRLSDSIHTHVGVAAGPHIILGNVNYRLPENETDFFRAGAGVAPEWLVRVGFQFALTEDHFVTLEPKLGRLFDTTIFFPQGSLTVAL